MSKEKIIRILKNTASVIVILSLFVIIFYQNRDRDIFKFGKAESSKIITPADDENSGEAYARCSIGKLGEKVAFLTPSVFSVLDKKAEGEDINVAYSNPVLYTDGNYAAIYDEGGQTVSVYKDDRLCYSLVTEEIMKAKVNMNGYCLVTTRKEGYNCECVVYNKTGEAIFRWDISKSEFLDGKVNSSNNKIILSVASAENDKLYGEIEIIDITTAKVIKKHRYEAQLFYDVETYKNDTCATFGSDSLIYINSDGEVKWEYGYKDKTLLKADISEPEMFVLAFSHNGSVIKGNSADVKVINRIGFVEKEKNFKGSLDDLAVTENAIAMAFGKTVIITDSKLKETRKLENDAGVHKIALFKDNKSVFIVSNTESKILK